MNIAVIGSGGREHSICFKLKQSKHINKIFCIPGNAGTNKVAENINIDILDFKNISNFLKNNNIKVVFVGPEIPLVNGIKDYLEKKNFFVFGPSKAASRLEKSKSFTKKLCKKYKIPTAKYRSFSSMKGVRDYIKNMNTPIVIKADGLASGKGVYICNNKNIAFKKCKEINEGKFKSSRKFVIEEFLSGEEASYFILSDGKNYKFFGTAQDHKRIGEGDTGPNTGGMGAYSPSNIITNKVEEKIKKEIIEPTLKGLKILGCPFVGILYAGLIIKDNQPKLIEYNIRLGDPECQVLMMRLKTDLLKIIIACKKKQINKLAIKWSNKKAITIVASSKGYPSKQSKVSEIKNTNKILLNNNQYLFHASTFNKNNRIFTSGGRVLNATAVNKNLRSGRNACIDMLKKINWKDKYFRKDIGWRVINS
ncbi:MAG: phosphoribosylamine--glycine ligase [Proteobacteria bacterium]|jgi:phosphoribosylamine--glycine ligase|nr:phosphoribosylamine--glycine ligase [Pseudomonadota bacterium]